MSKSKAKKRNPYNLIRNRNACAYQELCDVEVAVDLMTTMESTADKIITGVLPLGFELIAAMEQEYMEQITKAEKALAEAVSCAQDRFAFAKAAAGMDLNAEEQEIVDSMDCWTPADGHDADGYADD